MDERIVWLAFYDELSKIAQAQLEKDALWDELAQGVKQLGKKFVAPIPGTKPWVIGAGKAAEDAERAAMRAAKGGGHVLRLNPKAFGPKTLTPASNNPALRGLATAGAR